MDKRKWTVVFLAGLVAIILVPVAWHLHRAQQERRDIDQRYTAFHDAMVHGRTADACAIMSPAYRAKHDLGEFERNFDDTGAS